MAAKRLLTDAKEKQVAASYAKGKTSGELSTQFGVSDDVIRSAVTRQGGTLRPRGASPKTKNKK